MLRLDLYRWTGFVLTTRLLRMRYVDHDFEQPVIEIIVAKIYWDGFVRCMVDLTLGKLL
jgi:hypothetical protein